MPGEGIAGTVELLGSCTSPRTCNVPGGIRSLPPIVLSEEDLDGAPRGFNFVRVFPRDGMGECDGVVDGSVRVTV